MSKDDPDKYRYEQKDLHYAEPGAGDLERMPDSAVVGSHNDSYSRKNVSDNCNEIRRKDFTTASAPDKRCSSASNAARRSNCS